MRRDKLLWVFALLAITSICSIKAQTAPDQKPAASNVLTPAGDPIGNVATLSGTATITRFGTVTPLKTDDDIYMGDGLQTGANSTLSITFEDETTFNLSANSKITVDKYVYESGGKSNAALFNVARGTVAFVASAVAKTGDMKIATPTATLGIRGTTGLIEVPENAAAGTNDVAIKLYPDADGRVGHIEVNDRYGARLGLLSQGMSGFSIRPGAGGRFAATRLMISPQQVARDQGFVRQVHAAQITGRQIVARQRELRMQNPARQPGQRQQLQRQPLQRQQLQQKPAAPNDRKGRSQQQQPGPKTFRDQKRSDVPKPPNAQSPVNGPGVQRAQRRGPPVGRNPAQRQQKEPKEHRSGR
jgi:hypothetical protein